MRSKFIAAAWILSGLGVSGCSSQYIITSSPAGANIYYFDSATEKRFLIGTTPLSYSKSSLPGEKPFLVIVEKDGFASQEVPIAPTDDSRSQIFVTLKVDPSKMKKDDTDLNKYISQLFKAQQYIYKRQYQSALVEIEKVLKEKPELAQALIMKGTSYYLLDELPTAIAAWKSALQIDPNNDDLHRFLAEKNIVIR